MRVVVINGIEMDESKVIKPLEQALQHHLPGSKIDVEMILKGRLWQVLRWRRFIKQLVKKHDTGEDLLLVGHSLGGVVACAMQSRLKQSRVLGITTIHTPHRFFRGVCTFVLGAGKVTAPIISFQASFDLLVWWGTKHPKSTLHVKHRSNHLYSLIRNPELAMNIARITVEEFIHKRKAA